MPSRNFMEWLPYAEGVWEVALKFFENSVHNRWKNKKFQYLPNIQSRRVTASCKAGDLKFLTHVAEKYLYANI